jgi:PAS domain S-box-containing protein
MLVKLNSISPSGVRRWSVVLAITCLLTGFLVIVGWVFDVDRFTTPITGLTAMNPMTSLCFILLPSALLLLLTKRGATHIIAYGLVATTLAIGILRLSDRIFAMPFRVDMLLFPDQLNSLSDETEVRQSVSVAVNIVLISISIIVLHAHAKRKFISQWIALIVLLLSWFSILGYLYQVPEFYGESDSPYQPMALHTAFAFFILSLALLMANPRHGISKEIFSSYQGSETGRLILPVVFIAPVLLGYIRLWGHWKNLFSVEFGVAILVTGVTLVVIMMIFATIRLLNRRDVNQRRYQQDLKIVSKQNQLKHDEVNTLNEELASTNEEMTASNEELLVLNEQLHAAYDKIRQQSEIIVKQKDEQLNRVLDSSLDAIWSIDLTGKEENYLSRSAEKIFGEKVSGTMLTNPEVWRERTHPDDRETRDQSFDVLHRTGASEVTYRISTADNGYRWIHQRNRLIYDGNGTPARFEGIVSDMTEYKKQEQTIHQYRENLDILFNNTVEEILLLDEEGKVILYNRAVEKFLLFATGKKPEVGKYLWDTTSTERSEIAKKLFRRALNGEHITIDAPVQTPSGLVVHELRYDPVTIDNKVKYVTVISVDVTEKKEREELLRQSEARLRALFENTEDAFTLLDKNYIVLTFNSASAKIALDGLRPGINIFDILTPEQQASFKKHLDRVKEGETIKYDLEYGNKGEPVWYHVTISAVRDANELVGYCITTHDLTQIRKAEVSLKESEEKFRALIENTKDIIALANESGKALYVNPGVERITGFKPGEYMAGEPSEFVHPEDYRLFMRFLEEVSTHPGQLIETSFRAKHKEGYWQWLEGTAIDFRNHPAIKGIVFNFRDITQRKKAEQERSDLVGQLIEQNNDLRQFSFIASHNLRGPVASLLGLFNLLKLQTIPPESAELLAMASKAIAHLDSVIRDLSLILEMRSNRLNAKEVVSIRDTVDKVKVALQLQIDRCDITVIVDTSEIDGLRTIRSYFYSILYNLISNAIKFRSPERKPFVKIVAEKNGNNLLLSVSDNGIGINLSQFQDRLFGLYQRFHMESEGRGMGLYMVKTQVQLLNGTINIDSEPDKGTTFRISLPMEG